MCRSMPVVPEDLGCFGWTNTSLFMFWGAGQQLWVIQRYFFYTVKMILRWKSNTSVKPQKALHILWTGFVLDTSLLELAEAPLADLRNFADQELETDMTISGVLQMLSAPGCRNITPAQRGASGLGDDAEPSRENNQHLRWERSTAQRMIRDICKGLFC